MSEAFVGVMHADLLEMLREIENKEGRCALYQELRRRGAMFGITIGALFGDKDSDEVFRVTCGKTIAALALSEEQLLFTFIDGTKMRLFDDGQSYLKSRYMHSDDDLQSFVGSRLMDIEVRDVPDIEAGLDVHEVQFLVITTSAGAFTVETHCVHTGYYGGFALRATIMENSNEE